MADINQLIPLIVKWEGNYSDNPADSGGPTNKGVTLQTWRIAGYDKDNNGVIDKEDVKLITMKEMVETVLRPHYWNKCQADHIHNQAIANILVDWLWCSGKTAITSTQKIIGTVPDGIVGDATIRGINEYPDQEELFSMIKMSRIFQLERLCKTHPVKKCFKRGWLNRIADFRYKALILLLCICLCGGGCKSTRLLNTTTNELVGSETSLHELATLNNHQEQISLTDKLELICITDSITETFGQTLGIMAPGDSSVTIVPTIITHRTIVSRRSKLQQTKDKYQKVNAGEAVMTSVAAGKKTVASMQNLKQKPTKSTVARHLTGAVIMVLFILICILYLKLRLRPK